MKCQYFAGAPDTDILKMKNINVLLLHESREIWNNSIEEEISTPHSIDFVVWLLGVNLIEIYHKKEITEKNKLQPVNFEEKKAPEIGIEINSIFRVINTLIKEKIKW